MSRDNSITKFDASSRDRSERERARMNAQRPSTKGRPRGSSEPVELFENGERITLIGHATYASPLHAMKTLTKTQRETGVKFGAISAELETAGVGGSGVFSDAGGGSGGGFETAIERRIVMRDLLDRACACLDLLPAMKAKRAARLGKCSAELGGKHQSIGSRGVVAGERRPIPARVLVELVCVRELSIKCVLGVYGWPRNGGTAQKRASVILSEALDAISEDWGGGSAMGAGTPCDEVLVASEVKPHPFVGKPVERALTANGELKLRDLKERG